MTLAAQDGAQNRLPELSGVQREHTDWIDTGPPGSINAAINELAAQRPGIAHAVAPPEETGAQESVTVVTPSDQGICRPRSIACYKIGRRDESASGEKKNGRDAG